MSLGATDVERNGKTITWYQCRDCGMVYDGLRKNSLRPNNKFCDPDCMAWVLENRAFPYYSDIKRPRGWKGWVEAHDFTAVDEPVTD
jgi:hypothetical protein